MTLTKVSAGPTAGHRDTTTINRPIHVIGRPMTSGGQLREVDHTVDQVQLEAWTLAPISARG
jgi:hypothetical protein